MKHPFNRPIAPRKKPGKRPPWAASLPEPGDQGRRGATGQPIDDRGATGGSVQNRAAREGEEGGCVQR